MGRKKKELVAKSPVKLRRRQLADGRQSLFLDRSSYGKHEYEFLQLYLLPETTSKAKRQNAQTLRKAEEIVRQRTETLLNAKVRKPDGISSDMLLSEWIDTVSGNHARRGMRDAHGLSNTRSSLSKFRPEAKLKDVDRQFCLDYLNWLRTDYHTRWNKILMPKTAFSYSTMFRTVLNEAVREGVIPSNPWNQLSRADKIKEPECKREYLTMDEVKRMIDTPFVNEQVREAFLFSCFCGLRISDIRRLRWRDISIDGGHGQVAVVTVKTTTPVYIPLSQQAVKWLPERGEADADDPVFTLPSASNLNLNLKSWAKAAGITKHICFHTARHSCATMLLTLGADIYTVSKLLGHSSVETTQIYAKIIDKKKDAAAALVDNAFD